MRFPLLTLSLLFLSGNCFAQVDPVLAKKITLSNFCLCKTTLAEIKALGGELRLTDVEEMDLGKKCGGGEDARFMNGKGYYSSKYPGIIFQKDQDEDYISKIRLTNKFIGNLPEGMPVNLQSLRLKDIVARYPEPAFKWGSRDCSDYWSYSNDTISFFVKIDRDKKPQYPIDEDYYLERPIDGIDIVISCYAIYNHSNFSLFSPDEPMLFLDSIRTNLAMVETYDPSEIAFISVYKDSNALKLGGTDAKNGRDVFTKSFARRHYRDYFGSKSEDYKKYIPNEKADAKAVYILNGKVLEKNVEGDLFPIDDSNFEELRIIDAETLQTDYHISYKKIGVVIKTKASQAPK